MRVGPYCVGANIAVGDLHVATGHGLNALTDNRSPTEGTGRSDLAGGSATSFL